MWNTSDDSRLKRLERAVAYLACQIKNGGGGAETDPIFTASPAYTITQANIDFWNLGGIIPTLQSVTNQGNTTTTGIISSSQIKANNIAINSNGFDAIISSSNLTQIRNHQVPNKSGIFALLDDLPLIDDFSKYSQVRNVSYTSDNTNYYITGNVSIAVSKDLANDNGNITLERFLLDNSQITGTGITFQLTGTSSFIFPQNSIPDQNGNLITVGYSTFPFRITIPKATNTSIKYDNDPNAWLNFILKYQGFALANRLVPIVVPYALKAEYTLPQILKTGSIIASTLPNAQNDSTYTKKVVAKLDGTFGIVDNSPNIIITSALNYTLTPTITTTMISLTGTTTDVTLPPISSTVGIIIFIKNSGTSSSVIACSLVDGNGIWEGGLNIPTTNVATGTVMRITNDGLKYNVL